MKRFCCVLLGKPTSHTAGELQGELRSFLWVSSGNFKAWYENQQGPRTLGILGKWGGINIFYKGEGGNYVHLLFKVDEMRLHHFLVFCPKANTAAHFLSTGRVIWFCSRRFGSAMSSVYFVFCLFWLFFVAVRSIMLETNTIQVKYEGKIHYVGVLLCLVFVFFFFLILVLHWKD